MDQTLDEAIYNRYIAPTKRQRTGRVGLEFELPVVNREHAPVDFEVIHKVTDAFLCKFHFQEAGRDDDGFIYAALDGYPLTAAIIRWNFPLGQRWICIPYMGGFPGTMLLCGSN